MKNDPLKKLSSNIAAILKLEPKQTGTANELAKEILQSSKELSNVLQDKRSKGELENILARLDKQSNKLARSVLNSEKGSLRQDWMRFARNDFANLMDEILALREFLVHHRKDLRRSLNEAKYGADLGEVVELLREEEVPHRATLGQLTKRLSEMDERERQRATEIFSERISRMLRWFSILREARQEVEDAGQKS